MDRQEAGTGFLCKLQQDLEDLSAFLAEQMKINSTGSELLRASVQPAEPRTMPIVQLVAPVSGYKSVGQVRKWNH